MELQSQIKLPAALDEPLAVEAIDQAAKLFRQHGALLLENSFDPALVQTLQDDFMLNYAAMDRELVEKTCLKVGLERYMFTIRLQQPFMDPAVYAARRVLPIVQELLGKDCVLQSIGAVCAYPGSETQHVHRDHPDLFTEAAGLALSWARIAVALAPFLRAIVFTTVFIVLMTHLIEPLVISTCWLIAPAVAALYAIGTVILATCLWRSNTFHDEERAVIMSSRGRWVSFATAKA